MESKSDIEAIKVIRQMLAALLMEPVDELHVLVQCYESEFTVRVGTSVDHQVWYGRGNTIAAAIADVIRSVRDQLESKIAELDAASEELANEVSKTKAMFGNVVVFRTTKKEEP